HSTLSARHPIDDLVMCVIEDADVVGAGHLKELHKCKLTLQLATHSHRNYAAAGSMKSCDLRNWILFRDFTEIVAVVVTFDEQTGDPVPENRGCFFAQSCERRDQNNFLNFVMRRKIQRH